MGVRDFVRHATSANAWRRLSRIARGTAALRCFETYQIDELQMSVLGCVPDLQVTRLQ